ncbi:MAG: DUF4398 domain-containing protein [Polyangiaceae bacterium]|nr:DUF4398 domain-containing protein [Polyangiaceae bacterium]
MLLRISAGTGSRLALLVGSLVLAPLGCAGAPVPTQNVADARASAAAAQAVGAEKDPQAALHLELANNNMARAERLISNDEMDAAKVALVEAKVDADLALKLATLAESRVEVAQAQERLNDLTEQAGGTAQ